jgi:hypothetical protein
MLAALALVAILFFSSIVAADPSGLMLNGFLAAGTNARPIAFPWGSEESMATPRPNEPIPIPEPDVIRPPAPPEMPPPDVPSGLPEPGPDVVHSPEPSEIPSSSPPEVPALAPPALNERPERPGAVPVFGGAL